MAFRVLKTSIVYIGAFVVGWQVFVGDFVRLT